MSRWYRVFGRAEWQPAKDVLLTHLGTLGVTATPRVEEDTHGWTCVEFPLADGCAPLRVECFLASEPGIRSELNTWAAWLETCDYSPHHVPLMERVIQTKQLYTLRRPVDHADDARLDRVCTGVSQFLAAASDGVYQCDGEGVYEADGTLLLQEY